MSLRLSAETLGQLPPSVERPRYDRAAVTPGIVHLGVGAFHRAHQAAFIEQCLAAGQLQWGITGASLRSPDTRDALAPQDGLYALAVRDGDEERLQVIGALGRIIVAPEEPQALLEALAAPQTRIVTLTVTEKAYLRTASGGLDLSHPDIVADLADRARPRTMHGFIIEALIRRRAAGLAAFTVLSCDNLPANGETVRRVLGDFAGAIDSELGRLVREELACPSSMVDRIVPATTDADRARISASLKLEDAWPIVTEPFRQWVVEDHFPMGRPDWEQFGVTMVDDVTPYEDMKLRLLNGSHSAIAYLGQLLGLETVAEAFADAGIRRFVDGLWLQSASTLAPGLDAKQYTARLAERFANTALKHRTAQIANDGSQKLPQRIVAPALERLERGEGVAHLACVVAAWIEALDARKGATFADPLDEAIAAPARAGDVASIFEIAGFGAGSPHREALIAAVAVRLAALRSEGAAAALAALNKEIAP
ncbi:mannitol dehydrogenase [Youhaiella tibetensis]|uniref:Mannitol dehydrogenase family protein n=1 Tax=Paradevosia tibetensis TaxID=1447062 RepID=A0A5B9DMD0_9HYPH|nr:mannitol dehydrogenase family protein [Youhaiella tibetensis]QEE20055.1 mannitol dehydrogenase family protein [Youhaiella tibetensis]GGF27536.1 mannitol dehydrogenase [Youhaiella tibetensis]